MPEAEYRDWKFFYAREPWGLSVWDAMHAHVIATLANINRNEKKKPEPYQLKDFLLFAEPVSQQETWAAASERMRSHVRNVAAG